MRRIDIGIRAKNRFDRWLRDYPRATPIAVFILAFLLIGIASWSVEFSEKRNHIAAVRSQAAEIASALERQAAAETAYLDATGAVFASVDNVSPEFFAKFVDRLNVIYDFNGVLGIGWSESVGRGDLPGLRDRMKRAGFPDFQLVPEAAPTRWPVQAITMIEPQTPRNKSVVGYDMHSEQRRAVAMDRAIRTGTVAATDAVKLRQDVGLAYSPGFLVFVPVWSFGQQPRFRGFVYSPNRTADFVRIAVNPRLLASGRIEIHDPSPGGAEMIFASPPRIGHFDSPVTQKVSVFDQVWTLSFFAPARNGFYPLTFVVLFGGTAFSLLLLAYILLVQRRSGDLQALLEGQMERERERAAFVRELNHRVKNSLANVTSIISLTRHRATDVQNFADTLLQRVRALAASHTLLDGGQWGPTDLRAIVSVQVGTYDHGTGRISIDGPDVLISPNDALTVGLALHELATNAARYGSLSVEEGGVTVLWHIVDRDWVEVDWKEHGGPPVKPPEQRGFGLNLVERVVAHELGRPVKIDFEPDGLHCNFTIYLRKPKAFRFRS